MCIQGSLPWAELRSLMCVQSAALCDPHTQQERLSLFSWWEEGSKGADGRGQGFCRRGRALRHFHCIAVVKASLASPDPWETDTPQLCWEELQSHSKDTDTGREQYGIGATLSPVHHRQHTASLLPLCLPLTHSQHSSHSGLSVTALTAAFKCSPSLC